MDKQQRKRNLKYVLRIGVFALFTAVFVLFSSDAINGRWRFYLPKTIMVNGQEVVVDDSLALNNLTEEMFSVDERGRRVCTAVNAITGIDVSVYQKEVNWEAVAADGIDFVFLRAGYRGYGSGELRTDETFADNLTAAKDSGLLTGAYFFSQAVSVEEAQEEAKYMLEVLDGAGLDLPVVYDWEAVEQNFTDGDAVDVRTSGLSGETVTACALAFCQVIEDAGYDSMIYLNNDTGYFLYDIAQLQGKNIWYASYHDTWPNFYYEIQFWQYHQQGTVDGIEGPVDLNLWFPPMETETAGNAQTRGNADKMS